MNNEEAIVRINNLINIIKSPRSIVPYCPEEMEALDLAIKALENERPKGDLISREALKENGTVIGMVNGQKMKVVPLSVIDNAPTVEYTFEEAFQKTVCEQKLYCPKRPHGKWIDYSEEGFVECQFCHKATNCEDNIDDLHYCWNCGAKLEKGGAE